MVFEEHEKVKDLIWKPTKSEEKDDDAKHFCDLSKKSRIKQNHYLKKQLQDNQFFLISQDRVSGFTAFF